MNKLRINWVSYVIGLLISTFIVVVPAQQAKAVASLTITNMGWNVVGLDSNNVNAGPNNFPIGSKVCNNTAGSLTTNVTFTWADAVSTYIYEETGESLTRTVAIPAGTCQQEWWTILVNRNAASYDKSRAYTISATSGANTATTPSRTLVVEHLVSQNRNTVTSVVVKDGSGATISTASPGDLITIVFTGATSTSYPMVTAWPAFDSRLIQIQSETLTYDTTYRSPVTPSPVSDLMANGCNWDFANFTCLGDGKGGGNIVVTIQALIPDGANGSASLAGMIYDFSGSSYHYNSDYSTNATLRIGTVAPSATNDNYSVAPSGSLTKDVSINDITHVGGSSFETLTATSGGTGCSETYALTTSGSFTYSPGSCTGTRTFTYQMCDTSHANCYTATITITITSAHPITANDDSYLTNYQTAYSSGNISTNDTTTGVTAYTVSNPAPGGNPSHGTLTVNASGTFTYTPANGFSGTDTFDYKICENSDASNCDIATVSIVVGPHATDDSKSTRRDTAVSGDVTTNDAYPSGSSFEKVADPSNGTLVFNSDGSYTYTPSSGYTGTDTFTYKVCLPSPNTTTCSTATVTITISGGGGGGGSTPPVTPPTPPTTPPGNNNNPGRFTPTTPGNTNVILPPPPPGGTTQILVNGNPVCTTTTGICGVPALLGPKAKIEAIITNPDGTKVTEILPAYKPEKPIPALVVYFPLASYKLTAPEIKKINNFIKLVKEQGFTKLVLSGHTDVQGTVTGYDNVKLSNNRSKVVNAYLKKYLTVITTQSHHADTQPAVEGSGETVYKNNRRTQVAVW